MDRKLKQILQSIAEPDPPRNLANVILRKVELEREKWLKRELFLSYFGMASSLAILFYAIAAFGRLVVNSEFWSLALLAFSDLAVIAHNWRGFSYSLMETMPTVNIIAVLLPMFALMLLFNLYLNLRDKWVPKNLKNSLNPNT